MKTVIERFLEYVKFDTKSDENSTTVPSTKGQLVFGEYLKNELIEIGLKEVTFDNNGYLTALLPSNIDRKIPKIGFIAHMDTSPDMSGKDVNPQIVKNYDGGDIVLNREENIVLSPKEFKELKNYIGKTLITTDGNTLLGADDKAGIAEIITAMEYLVNNKDIPHGDIKIGFTPDEEIGSGADHFDVDKFDADFAYTLDGGPIGELEYENFNAAGFKVDIKGKNVHPGTAKGIMINSMLIGSEFIETLPKEETPENTEGYEGFYLLTAIKGEVEHTTLHYIIRDFYRESFNKRKEKVKEIVERLNNKYGSNTITLDMKDQYYNMKEKVEPFIHVVENAKKAMEQLGIKPLIQPIRGGTDGARLSFMGLPTPNIFTGGHNYHGRFEYIPTYSMEKAVEVILKIIEIYSK